MIEFTKSLFVGELQHSLGSIILEEQVKIQNKDSRTQLGQAAHTFQGFEYFMSTILYF